jgi:serine/threonine protein kinase
MLPWLAVVSAADVLHLARTLEARLAGDPGLARTMVERPDATIEPPRLASSGGLAAIDALRALGATLGGRIEVHDTIGEGGMGVVHLATQATLGRHVAVKTLRKGIDDHNAALRILREAWVTGALEHPNIVPVHDVGVDATGAPVIVMKRIEGHPWSSLMRDPEALARLFSAHDALEWNLRTLASVCNAVHFAHSRGILHRDLKPDNVMIGEFGEVYVLDWGIAVSLTPDPSGRLPPASQATDVAGTPHYMAPEMLLGDPGAYSPRTDVYLLGGIFYEIFAGEPPHRGDSVHAIVTDILLSSPRFAPGFPPEARRICQKALGREPRDRFESAEALRVAIEEYLRHRGSRKLARDAKESCLRLQKVLETEPPGEERKLAVAHLLGECRFGYHAALSAWPENEAARHGLDAALLLVIDHLLAEGDAWAADALLREVSAPPAGVVERVQSAVRAREQEEERLRRMQSDLDPRVGTRTRTVLGAFFGATWTVWTLAGWVYAHRVARMSYFATVVLPALVFLALCLLAWAWARETLSKTLLNRRLGLTLLFYLVAQLVLAVGGWLMGLSATSMHLVILFSWGLTYLLVAIWAQRWFALPAAAAGVSFLVACAFPSLVYALMSLVNLVLTVVLVKTWFPRQDLERIREWRRQPQCRSGTWPGPR